ncbi:unnamed protein product [Parnassius apollo]|uniref:Regulatory protein zeste n=1 Tax=Parnassius apollo TaxID=110799 RepID=A0A8S3WFN6_PARAO|nr:unnamed protein product [Parnassius apollo]
MDRKERQRCIYVSARQKKKLIELMTEHPELISCKVTNDFNYKDSQKLWQNIANECNSIPGAKKTWRQWRKTWHDLRSKTKKRHAETNREVTRSTFILTDAEQEALGVKNVTEFIPSEVEVQQESLNDNLSEASISEAESLTEEKVFVSSTNVNSFKLKNNSKHSSRHSSNCNLNCDMIASQEQKKLELKEDYLSFKKEYLRQKLKLIKEQTDALKSIAKELSK